MNETSNPSWNSSTMCLQVLHSTMKEQGWNRWQPATPLRNNNLRDYDCPRFDYELPRRPLDLGVGLWR
ncbi:MAG TPA: hypothetical protein VFC19_13035 [Candidatus Limnocylindrales bacterium]|nr:hypothetical protein [Candidatus Limnocylindrales bacterium]